MKNNYRTFFILGIILALVTALVSINYLTKTAGLVQVAVSAQDIYADAAIGSAYISATKIPVGALQSDTVQSPQFFKGKVAKGYIPKGTVLKEAMFDDAENISTAGKLKQNPNMVAFALEAKLDTTCGGLLQKGSLVDVKAIPKKMENFVSVDETTTTVATETIAVNVEVLDVPSSESKIEGVLLMVSPEIADTIIETRTNSDIIIVVKPTKE